MFGQELLRNQVLGPNHVQSYSWPPIARGCDSVIISPENDPLVYLPPLITFLQSRSCYVSLPARNGVSRTFSLCWNGSCVSAESQGDTRWVKTSDASGSLPVTVYLARDSVCFKQDQPWVLLVRSAFLGCISHCLLVCEEKTLTASNSFFQKNQVIGSYK